MNDFRLRPLPCLIMALALLSQPTLAAAQTDTRPAQAQVTKHTVKKHVATARKPVQRNLYNAAPARDPAGCTWPYRNQFPPCMATWPAGDQNYHGSRPGPTFDSPY
jgi:hypothetical protein